MKNEKQETEIIRRKDKHVTEDWIAKRESRKYYEMKERLR